MEVILPHDMGIRLPHIITKMQPTSVGERPSGHPACTGPGPRVDSEGGKDTASSKTGWLPSPVRVDELAESIERGDGRRSIA